MDDKRSMQVNEESDQIESASGTGQTSPRKRLTRRQVLAGLAAVSVAAACGRTRATPTPSPTTSPLLPTLTPTPTQVGQSSLLRPPGPYALHLPVIKNGGLRISALPPEPTLTPTPSKTATPTMTPTPEPPTPTPTPQATPFPPGPPSKLGLFVARNDPQIFDLLETGAIPVVKTLELDSNFVGQIKQVSPNTRIIGRMPHGELADVSLASLDPLPAARAYVERLLPYADDPARRPYFDGWETFNEPVANTPEEMRRWGDFEAERTRLLGERGIRSVIGNFGTGQPSSEDGPLVLWEYFLQAVQAATEYDGWLGLHEYSAPTIYHLSTRDGQGRYPGVSPEDTGWLTLRYRQVYNQILIPRGLAIPLVLTELGVDGLVANRPGPVDAQGWQHFQDYWAQNGFGNWGPGAYIEQLVWYDDAMRQDSYVIGGCIYAMAGSSGWESYDILGPAAAVLQQYLSVHAPA